MLGRAPCQHHVGHGQGESLQQRRHVDSSRSESYIKAQTIGAFHNMDFLSFNYLQNVGLRPHELKSV